MIKRSASGVSSRLQGFQKLMPFRVREVLLLASRYDSYILEEEGLLTELIMTEYDRLNLRYAPRLNSTPSAKEALEALASGRRFDLVIVTLHPGAMDPADFARAVKERHPHLPVVLLGYDNRELQELVNSEDAAAFDEMFVWTGDASILLAIVNVIEDARNVEHDVAAVGVEVIILIDDSVTFISSLLPILYGKLTKQSQRLISEGITLAHKVLRMRARPKVLLARSYEEAATIYQTYRQNVLGIISDVRFLRDDQMDDAAGVEFARFVREDNPDIPILLQSTDAGNSRLARRLGVGFADKNSPKLRQEIEQFMRGFFGFGPFVFRMPDGTKVGEANDLRDLRRCLATVPAASLAYHTEGNHLSTWLKARTEFRLAHEMRPHRVTDFDSLADMRRGFIQALDDFRRESYRDAIADFSPDDFGSISNFSRIGGGSLGGKARGLAFLNMLLREHGAGRDHAGVELAVPPTVVIGTEMFDEFMEANDLTRIARSDAPDEAVRHAFLAAKLPPRLVRELRALAEIMDYPVAVRSSSLLEDSHHQPFAGVYETYMLAGGASDAAGRLDDLCAAIKLVYASTFSAKAKSYLRATPKRPEHEKMAVILQKLIGRQYADRFYPSFAGVAQSYNYYPFGRIRPHDGVARVAVGLGRLVVEGRGGLRFCPKYPRHLPQFSTVDDMLANSQKEFDALPIEPAATDPHERYQPSRYAIQEAVTEDIVGSVYSPADNAVYDGSTREGTPIISFAGILKHQRFPLPALLEGLLEVSTSAMGMPIEIEFAVELGPDGEAPAFACLQLRPLTVMRDVGRIDLTSIGADHVLCESPRALGNGRIRGISDVVCIFPDEFDRRESVKTAAAVSELNALLREEGRPYLLVGPGRWGSADPWLGVPVSWGQIAGARIIVETGLAETLVTPSEGSHFFHNMTAFQVGYMTTNPDRDEGRIDWQWLRAQEVKRTCGNGLCWITLSEPLLGLIEGESGEGVIVKAARHVPGLA